MFFARIHAGLLIVAVLVPARAEARPHKKPKASWEGKLEHWRKKRLTATDNFGAFCRPNLLANIKKGSITLLDYDHAQNAKSCSSRACKFVIIRKRSARIDQGLKGEKVLGIPTERQKVEKQPLCVLDVKRTKLDELGRIMRAVLTCPERIHPPDANRAKGDRYTDWVASVHLPNALTMPVLHVHGQFRQQKVRDRITISKELLQQRDYKTHKGVKHRRGTRAGSYDLLHSQSNALHRWEVVALARGPDGKPIKLSDWLERSDPQASKLDHLVARMVKDVYRQAVKHGTTFGQVVIDRDDPNLVVRAVRH
jgi:hypothetical protein